LSGLPVSGKSTLTRTLSEVYGWPIHSIGDLWRARHKVLYPNGKVSFEEYWRGTSIEDNRKINEQARKIYAAGKIVGDTRYSIYCKDLPVLLVFITADLEVRAKRGIDTKYRGKSIEDVKQILIEREECEVKMGKELFDFDYRDIRHYHLALNSGVFSVEEEVEIIRGLVPKTS